MVVRCIKLFESFLSSGKSYRGHLTKGWRLNGHPFSIIFGACRVSQLVAVTGAFQFSASEVSVISARPADACPVAFSAHCQPLVRHSRGGRNANSMNAKARTERTASRRNAFNILPSLNQR